MREFKRPWVIQYRCNKSSPPWHDAQHWADWLEPDITFEACVTHLVDVLARPECHPSWHDPQIEFRVLNISTGEEVPWTALNG